MFCILLAMRKRRSPMWLDSTIKHMATLVQGNRGIESINGQLRKPLIVLDMARKSY
jgi:hypothetical protein